MEIVICQDDPVDEQNNVNYMPCSIAFNGKAKVSSYFKESTDKNGVKHASFRGRPLVGSEVTLPEGYCGYVLKKPPPETNPINANLTIEQSFKRINYWNLDRIPSSNDSFLSTLDWMDISKALHSQETSKITNGKGDETHNPVK